MKLALFLLPKAEEDIEEHCSFIARNSVEKALDFDRAVFESFDQLCVHPQIGSRYISGDRRLIDMRMWFVTEFPKYLIFYRAYGNYVEVVRVLHSAQDRYAILLEEE